MRILSVFLVILSLISVSGCARHEHDDCPEGNAMYFWRTTLDIDSTERSFLKEHDIRRLYIRFFDVIAARESGRPLPNATLTFPDTFSSLPAGMKYVPVVFVMPEAVTSRDRDSLPAGIVDRVLRMAEAHSLTRPEEIQIDCDWTASMRDNFFGMMKALREYAAGRGLKTSVTIRLHQLSQEAPEADYGVLMVYNTGDLRTPEKGNPILSREMVMPYLRYVEKYPLPLVAAYPSFRWPAIYAVSDDGKLSLRGLLYGCRPDTIPDLFRQTAPDVWTAVSSRRMATATGNTDNVTLVTPGMRLYMFSPSFETVRDVENALEESRPGINRSVILYELSDNSINLFTSKQYEEIFNR